MIYGVTGSTGSLGTLVVRHLQALGIPSSSIVSLARSESKAGSLKAAGLRVRIADYDKAEGLAKALEGVDRLLLVSGSEVGKRLVQHRAVIDAARSAGVKLLAYTSLSRADVSINPLAPEHRGTEEYLRASGLPFVILRDNWYTENYFDDLRGARGSGIIAAAVGKGKVASASRGDYAEAAARVLVGEKHEGKTYELTGSHAWDYAELAKTAGELLGRRVDFKALSPEERRKGLLEAGLPAGAADFVTSLDLSIEKGSLAAVSRDLENILGRAPLSLKEGLKPALDK